jgi:hypothetical protein
MCLVWGWSSGCADTLAGQQHLDAQQRMDASPNSQAGMTICASVMVQARVCLRQHQMSRLFCAGGQGSFRCMDHFK